jgi:hypothetical protein
MSDTTNTIITAAGIAGALYLGHQWLSRKDASAAPVPAGSPPVTEGAAPMPPATSAPAEVDAALPRTYDAEFANHGQRLPLAYLRALASRESDLSPSFTEGPAWGLLGIDDVTRSAYNKRHGTRFRQVDLLTPAINVAIGADQLRLIIAYWRRLHGDLVNLQENWTNARFVELLTFGWASAFGNQAGVGRVADYLRRRGITDITADKVYAHAGSAGASPKLSREQHLDFAKTVARLYDRERVGAGR